MKKYNKILEAIQKGINIALDDFEDEEIQTLIQLGIKDKNLTKENIDFYSNFVDMGLPSGTKWFKYNLGCDWKMLSDHPENSMAEDWYGNYYAWGELSPKDWKDYTWAKYKFGMASELTKYNNEDHLITLLLTDDAAYKTNPNMRMPSEEQIKELIDNSLIYWKEDYIIKGLNGVLVRSKINGNELFFPAAGYISYYIVEVGIDTGQAYDIHNDGYGSYIWSTKRNVIDGITARRTAMNVASACMLSHYNCEDNYKSRVISSFPRMNGFSIRPILKND